MSGIKRLLVGAATQSTMKGKAMGSALASALTKQETANSSATGKEKHPLTSKAIGK